MIHHVGVVTGTHPRLGNRVLDICQLTGNPPTLVGEKYILEYDCYCYLYKVGFESQTLFELVHPRSGKLLEWLDQHPENSMHHMAIKVGSILATMNILKMAGVPLLSDNPVVGVNEMLVNFVHPSYSGVMLELVEEVE